MSKLVDKERLAKLAQALDARAKAAVAAEAARADAAEKAIDAKADANAAAIATINNVETGILAQAKSHAQGLVDGEKERAEGQEGILLGKIQILEGIVGTDGEAGALGKVIKAVEENTATITKLDGADTVEGSVKKQIKDAVKVEKDRAEGVEAGFETRIAANEAFVAAQPAIDAEQNRRLGVLEGLISGGEGDENALTQLQKSIDAAQSAADAAQADVDAVEQRLDAEGGLVSRIAANETTIAKLDGAVDVEGSVKKQIADAIAGVKSDVTDGLTDRVEALETFKDTTYPAAEAQVRADFASADATNLQAAKDYADEKITALVNSAPEAMDTLKELADAIQAHGTEYEAYVATVSKNIATAKQEAIDAAASKDATLKTELQKEIDDDVKVEADRAAGEEAKIREEMATEAARVNKKIADDIATESALRVAEEAKIRQEFAAADTALHTTISAEIDEDVKAEKERAEGVEADLLAKINKEVSDRETAVSGVQGEVDTLENVVKDMKDATKDGSLAKQIADEIARADAEEKDIRADFAAADEALHTTIKGEMAQVVASLSVQIVDNKLQIGLGQGVEFVTLNQFELEMATDDDIDAIINGLDA